MSIPTRTDSPASTSSQVDSSPASLSTPPNSAAMTLPTPVEPEPASNTPPTANSTNSATAPTKRKASRRANTAERRATHNAVERQRRETLNGRFLDLAALLPNLATVRRPSKSAIVNSSIALIHSNRRQRLLAARELRVLKVETDAIRRELNEWRERSGVGRLEEPARTPEFLALLSIGDGECDSENWWHGESLDEMGEEERKAYALVMGSNAEEDGDDMLCDPNDDDDFGRPGLIKNNSALSAGSVNLQHILPRNMPNQHMRGVGSMPAIASPTTLGFDHPHLASHNGIPGGLNTMYEPNGHPHPQTHSLPVHPNFGSNLGLSGNDSDADKVWNAQMYSTFSQQSPAPPQWAHQLPPSHHQTPHALFTPPGTGGSTASNGGGSPHSNPFSNSQAQAFLSSLQHQPQRMSISLPHGHVYATPEDDASSVGSGDARSNGGSPQPHNGSFKMTPNGSNFARKPSLSLNVPNVNGPWTNQPSQPIVAGEGGRYFASAMGLTM